MPIVVEDPEQEFGDGAATAVCEECGMGCGWLSSEIESLWSWARAHNWDVHGGKAQIKGPTPELVHEARLATATDEDILEALRAGESGNSITRRLHTDGARVKRLREANGIPVFSGAVVRRFAPRPTPAAQRALDAYRAYGSYAMAAKALGVSNGSIQHAVARWAPDEVNAPVLASQPNPDAQRLIDAYREHGSYGEAARALGVHHNTVRSVVLIWVPEEAA